MNKRKSVGNEKLLKELDNLKKENQLLKDLLTSRSSEIISVKKENPDKALDSFSRLFKSSLISTLPSDTNDFLMWTKDTQGRYTSVNKIFAEKYGHPESFFQGITDYDFLPRVFADKFNSNDIHVIKTAEPLIVEELLPVKTGFAWYETIKIPIFVKNKVTGVASMSKDITHRKRNEQALRESEEKFRELAENTSDSFILRSGKQVLYVNPAFEKVYGYSRKDIINDPDLHRKWIHPDDRERIMEVLKSEDYRSTFIFNEQYRIVKKDGTESWIWNRSFPVWNDKGEVYRIVAVASNISEIKYLEQSLRKSQSQLQAILDNIPHLAWLKGADGKYISVNKSFAAYFKLPPEKIIGKDDYKLCARKLADDYTRKDNLVANTRQSRQFYEIEKRNGSKRYSETHKAPILNEEGDVIGIAGISRDITDQKLAETALIRSEEKFKDLVTLLPEVVFETDKKGVIIFANLKGFELMEYSHSDLIKGKTIFDLIIPEDIERVKEIFKTFRYGSELKGKEFRVVTKSGKIVPVLIFTNNMYQDNEWAGIRGVMVDISRRKEAEKQEKIYQSKLLYLSDTALDFLSMGQDNNLYTFIGSRLKELLDDCHIVVNRFDERNMEVILEYHSLNPQEEQIIFNTLRIPASDFRTKTNKEQLKHLQENSEHLFKFENGFYESTFGKIPYKVSIELQERLGIKGFYGMAMMRNGKLFGSILILTPVDQLKDKHFIETFIYQSSIALQKKQLEVELIEAKRLAEESDRLKTSFLANMSHEIRTPMNGILGLTEMLARQNVEPKKFREYLSMISANGKLLLNLVNDIIDISKIEAKQVDIHENEFSLKELLDEVNCIISAERMVKGRENVELKYELLLNGNTGHVSSDQAKLKQILINLIGNSVKFTQSGGVYFGCEVQENNELLFYVKDTGIGIPESKLNIIFERFTQADESLTRPYSGSGLGLAISKGFVELMGGRIWAESKLGKGSRFYFTVPYKPVIKKKVMKSRKKEITEFNWKDLNILIVEDNLVSYKLLEISLSKTGCKIHHAENGVEAIEMVKQNPEIDVVLMDIQLPVMNGYDATREIKKIKPELPVIAQTANAMDSDRVKCLDAGCSDYITKPIVLNDLMPVIELYVKDRAN